MSRPRLEPLEDRLAPAGTPIPGSAAGLLMAGGKPSGAVPIQVTVNQNGSGTVIDLAAAFSTTSGIQYGGGLKLSVLGNTNVGLVKTDLSEAALTLTAAPGRYGTATILVGATDADGVSVTRALLVTVGSATPARVVHVTPTPAGLPAPTPVLPSP